MGIQDKPQCLRVGGARGIEQGHVDRKAGVIHDYSVLTRGEARGHEMWVDAMFLDQVVAAGNASAKGIKSRFTHPGLSGDGLGTAIGRTKNFRLDGDRVLGDLHFLNTASHTPRGDLRTYVTDFADESPDLFGASIVFQPDRNAEEAFRDEHTDDGKFMSPDKDNAKGLRHFRLAALVASDVVDEPAANPDGLLAAFTEGSELPALAESALSFALGLSDEAPGVEALGIHPDRLRAFCGEFLSRRNLSVSRVREIGISEETGENAEIARLLELLASTVPSGAAEDSDGSDETDLGASASGASVPDVEQTTSREAGAMGLKEITLAQLQSERPDLAKALFDEGHDAGRAEGKDVGLTEGRSAGESAERARCLSLAKLGDEFGAADTCFTFIEDGTEPLAAENALCRAKLASDAADSTAATADVAPADDKAPASAGLSSEDAKFKQADERAAQLRRENPQLIQSEALSQALREINDRETGR